MSDINTTTLTGRLVRDPLLRQVNNGRLMGLFTLASNQRYKDKNGAMQEETAFVQCKVFGGWAEPLAHHKKGDMAVVAGRLKTEKWEKDGAMRYELLLICESLHFVGPESGAAFEDQEPTASSIAQQVPIGKKNGAPPF